MATKIAIFKQDILKQEIELLVQRIDHFDDLRHRTKQMAATLWVAAVGAALTIPSFHLLWLALGIPLPFWYFDACYNAYQAGFSRRFWEIRAFIRDGEFKAPDGNSTTLDNFLEDPDSCVFPVPDYYGNKTFDKQSLESYTSILRNAITPKMLTFYGSLTLAAIVLILVYTWLNGNRFE